MTKLNLPAMTRSANGRVRKSSANSRRSAPAGRKQALDPFFVFTYTLLALALALQLFLMVWMDLF